MNLGEDNVSLPPAHDKVQILRKKKTTSLNGALEGIPTIELWDIVSDVLEPPVNRASGDPSKTIQQPIDITPSNAQCASHLSALVFHHSHSINLQWRSISYISSILGMKIETFCRVMSSTRAISRFGGGPMAQSSVDSRALESRTSQEYEEQIEDCKLGAVDRFVQNFELNNHPNL